MAEHSTPDRAAILAALDQVRDPRSGRGLAAAGLVQALVAGPDRAGFMMEVAAGEYNYDVRQARAMLEAGAVDVLQADATRCGLLGFLQMEAMAEAFETPMSLHTAPAIHAHLGCGARRVRHVEYFFDHVRIEQLFFDGATVRHKDGFLRPDLAQPGFGLVLKTQDAEKYRINI